ncbi:hypothetical protein VTN00DRAFT_4293 [Thermoascus crustaceus]|uniref:uncharacterized protein n=1 Tax=Thermoascus crustaceus TaxID=5088 RepID=UPI003742F1D7
MTSDEFGKVLGYDLLEITEDIDIKRDRTSLSVYSCEPVGSGLTNAEGIYFRSRYINCFLDTRLDLLPGKTANMLRLERFSNWFVDRVGGDSEYEKEILRTIRLFYSRLWHLDSYMQKARFRYKAMLAMNPLSEERQKRQATGDETTQPGALTSGWSRGEWYHFYPNGIPAFSSQEFRTRYKPLMNSSEVRSYSTKEDGFVRNMHKITSELNRYLEIMI